jgi:hypothetical protein
MAAQLRQKPESLTVLFILKSFAMKKTKTMYRIFTILFAFAMLGSAIPDILVAPVAVEGFRQIGLPAYLVPFMGIAKLCGVVAILVPGYPRIKEWAYAGLIFDLVGATFCVSAGKSFALATPMFIFIGIGFLSYAWYHKNLKRQDADPTSFDMQQNLAAGIS